ncbi:MAG TPA: PTS sugar transporter subunit IIA [Stellaceae bacterium]|jgi:PTS system nitrogen regulatory IIA component|nr:PTS sugar transporter subunit IIA [Stellaceae bacterium]
MSIADLLSAESVTANLRVSSKKQALVELSKRAAAVTGQPEKTVFTVMNEREQAGSTGVGAGIAIPHGKLAGLTTPLGVFARLERPIDFDAIDGQPIDLIFMLLLPEGDGPDHLKVLARVSRLLRNRALCDKLRATDRADALYMMLTEVAASHAA